MSVGRSLRLLDYVALVAAIGLLLAVLYTIVTVSRNDGERIQQVQNLTVQMHALSQEQLRLQLQIDRIEERMIDKE